MLPTSADAVSAVKPWWRPSLAHFALVGLALPDLVAAPISPTIHRQTQTYIQIANLADYGLSWDAFSININGARPFRAIFEFPIYHGLSAVALRLLSHSWLWPKLLSLLATCVTVVCLRVWISQRWGRGVAAPATIVFATMPLVLLMATAIQPDALALALTTGLILAMERWRLAPNIGGWLVVLVLALLALLVKFTVVVPFVPVLAWLYLRSPSGIRWPRAPEIATAVLVIGLPFVWWLRVRAQHTDPGYLRDDQLLFLGGELRRFLSPGFYVKPLFVIGAMVCAGTGAPLMALGARRLDAFGWTLVAGIPLYFVLIATAADQTYYSFALAPIFAILIGRGWSAIERQFATHLVFARALVIAIYAAGLAVAVPYTLRRDEVTWNAAKALEQVSRTQDFALVLNMHDRGVGIGGFNPAMLVLANRKGGNISPGSTDTSAIAADVSRGRSNGARWLVATWFTPALDPWFTSWLPGAFSRQPRLQGELVDGRRIVEALTRQYPEVAMGDNYAVLRLDN